MSRPKPPWRFRKPHPHHFVLSNSVCAAGGADWFSATARPMGVAKNRKGRYVREVAIVFHQPGPRRDGAIFVDIDQLIKELQAVADAAWEPNP